jgi:hypothetical protein
MRDGISSFLQAPDEDSRKPQLRVNTGSRFSRNAATAAW